MKTIRKAKKFNIFFMIFLILYIHYCILCIIVCVYFPRHHIVFCFCSGLPGMRGEKGETGNRCHFTNTYSLWLATVEKNEQYRTSSCYVCIHKTPPKLLVSRCQLSAKDNTGL